ncbi:hypothetical protein NXT3_PB00357 (plasmid) [Sinorhizobium fredii]|uniref:Uncharacterized protein n=1 Tax=Rhizobium fredii TaxID=380 RepID=A0A2L0HCW4_RHIFR|nr:hypothetical protein NXT3_PB00357 [Sinorhizobium fredii]
METLDEFFGYQRSTERLGEQAIVQAAGGVASTRMRAGLNPSQLKIGKLEGARTCSTPPVMHLA